MSIYLGNNLVSGVATPIEGARNIGQIIQSTVPLPDAGLHLLDGSLISGSGSYSAFVTYIAGLVSSYPDLFTTEANWQTAVSTYGVCGKFVYDSVNNTVRLPKITGFTEGTIDPTVLGDLVQAGLPNITGYSAWACNGFCDRGFSSQGSAYNKASGALYATKDGGAYGMIGSSGSDLGSDNTRINIDASRSSSIYGNSSTVQPQSIKVLYYIVIATSVKTEIEVDIDEIATDLNGKADVDLTNVNASGKSLVSGWAMPSNQFINLTVGASGASYTAPANGWFCIKSTVTNATSNYESGYETSYGGRGQITTHGYSSLGGAVVPVLKGQTITFTYQSSTTNHSIRFVYAKGEN